MALVGVSLDEQPRDVDRFVSEKSVFWPEICDGKSDEGEIAKLYNVTGTPDIFVIDRSGEIAARLETATALDQQLIEVSATDPFPPRTQRDSWQRPVQVMDDLHIRPGSAVADVGAGGGYFTYRLAARVGAKGKVYAEDLDEKPLAQIREHAAKENLTQLETIRGTENDPELPAAALDAVLVVDAFHEFRDVDAMLAGINRALKPGGRLGVIDASEQLGLKPADYMDRHRLPQETLVELVGRSGLRLVSFQSTFAGPPGETKYYFAVFEKP